VSQTATFGGILTGPDIHVVMRRLSGWFTWRAE